MTRTIIQILSEIGRTIQLACQIGTRHFEVDRIYPGEMTIIRDETAQTRWYVDADGILTTED